MSQILKPEHWVELHADYLYNYAVSMLRSGEEAQDLIQDTFLAAYNSKNEFKGLSSERTWLTSILRNKILDHFRKSKTASTHFNDSHNNSEFFNTSGMLEGFWKKEKGPLGWETDSSIDAENLSLFLQLCIEKLPITLAGCIKLRYLEGVSSEEICKVLFISESNLWTRLHRAKLQLRACLEQSINMK